MFMRQKVGPLLVRVLSYSPLPAAVREYHCGNKDVAIRIFERGMELFADELEYVLRYLNFLISINDGNSGCIY